VIGAILTLWLAWQTISPEALQHLEAGRQAEKQLHFDVAIAEFRKVTELEPSFAEGFVDLGQAFMQHHDYDAAVAPLKRALELNPNFAPAHRLLGYALLTQGYAEEAIPHLQQVQEQAALGIAQLESGKLPEAVATLQGALQKHPNDQDLLYYLGRASGLLSKQSIDTMLAAYPDSARGHQALAENYFILRQMPEAEKHYQEALRIRPDMPNVHLELGQVYSASSRWPQAEEEFRAETKLRPGNAEAAYRLGDALLQQGRAREARQELQRSNQLQPDMPETLYSLGKAASLDGDTAAAEKAWSKLLTIENETSLAAQTHFALAGLYRKQGKVAEAGREMQAFQKLHNPASQPEVVPK
jgi:tetratricopeptide (TPR) repeat protein